MNNRHLFFALVLLLSLSACGDDTTSAAAVTPTEGTTPIQALSPNDGTDPAGEKASDEEIMAARSEKADAPLTRHYDQKNYGQQAAKMLKALQQNYWYIHAMIKSQQPEYNLRTRGRWYQFNEDGTFNSGYLDQTGKGGTWEYDPVNAFIHLKANNFEESGEYGVKMGNSGTVMIWEGTARYNQTAIQGKLEKYNKIGDYQLPAPQ